MDIESALNTLIAGQQASTFNAGEDQYDVIVRAQEKFRGSAEGLAEMTVPSSKVGSVRLDEVAHITPGTGPSSINRIARQRQVTLTGNVLPGGSQAEILTQLNQAAAEIGMEPGYHSGLTGGSKELARTGYYFVLAFGLTFIFMYIVLAAQFESFIHPITILITLPLAVPFGIVSLLIMGQTVNIFSGLGLLLLFGIVKKNAILQIDHTNGLRQQGMNRYDAIIQANRDRLRPILMTTIALVAGMAPLVISRGTGAATNRSIGVLVVGGQSLCLLLTLLAVPVFYSLFEDLGQNFVRRSRFLRGRFQKVVAVGAALVGSVFGTDGSAAQSGGTQAARRNHGTDYHPAAGSDRACAGERSRPGDFAHSSGAGGIPHSQRAGLLRSRRRAAGVSHPRGHARGFHHRRHGGWQTHYGDVERHSAGERPLAMGRNLLAGLRELEHKDGQPVHYAQPAVSNSVESVAHAAAMARVALRRELATGLQWRARAGN